MGLSLVLTGLGWGGVGSNVLPAGVVDLTKYILKGQENITKYLLQGGGISQSTLSQGEDITKYLLKGGEGVLSKSQLIS